MTENIEVTTLYRPVGSTELELIQQSGYRRFPPRLADQPIFYPVLTQAYAEQIARDWNVKHTTDHRGFVTRFNVSTAFISRYEVHTVGGSEHKELWVPAAELDDFNNNILGTIDVIAEFTSV